MERAVRTNTLSAVAKDCRSERLQGLSVRRVNRMPQLDFNLDGEVAS